MADMRKWNEKWMWHEGANSWVATYRGILVEVPGSPEKGPPHFTAEAWVEASPDSPMRANDAKWCGHCGETSVKYLGPDLNRRIDVFRCDECGMMWWERRLTRSEREREKASLGWKIEGPNDDACFFSNDGV